MVLDRERGIGSLFFKDIGFLINFDSLVTRHLPHQHYFALLVALGIVPGQLEVTSVWTLENSVVLGFLKVYRYSNSAKYMDGAFPLGFRELKSWVCDSNADACVYLQSVSETD